MAISTYSWMSAPGGANATEWRKWVQGVHDGLLAAGLVQTADSGQIDIPVTALPTYGSWSRYEVWRFNDALQATAPVFMRVEYGIGIYGSGRAGIRIQIGTSTNGAGVIGGSNLLPLTSINGASDMVASSSEYASYASGDGSSVNMVLWPTYDALAHLGGFSVSRSCGTDGEYNADAIVVSIFGNASMFNVVGTNGSSGSVKSSQNAYAPVILPYTLNGANASIGSTMSEDGTTAPIFPIPCAAPGVPPFVLNSQVVIHPGDAGATSVIQVATVNGEERTYRAFPVIGAKSGDKQRGNVLIMNAGTFHGCCYPAIAWAV